MCAWLDGLTFDLEFSENLQAKASYIKIPDYAQLLKCREDYQRDPETPSSYLDKVCPADCDTLSQCSVESGDFVTPSKTKHIEEEPIAAISKTV